MSVHNEEVARIFDEMAELLALPDDLLSESSRIPVRG